MLRLGTIPVGRSRRHARLATLIASIGLLASVSGCGLLSGEDDSSSSDGNGAVEQADITVSTLPVISVAPLHLAVQEGYFKEEGLNVKIDQAASGQAALTKMISGDSEIAFSSYVPFLVAQSKGAVNLKFVAESSSMQTDYVQIVAMPNSPVEKVQDLEGKKVAVSALNTISDTLVKSVMKTNNLDYRSVQFVPTSFPDIAGALARGDVDAGLLAEPFLTQSASSEGTISVADTGTGPTKDIPLDGYAATSKFAEENPKTVAAFQRALVKATADAEDRGKLEPILVDKLKVDKETASLVELPAFSADLDVTRLQRVADLSHEFGIIPEKIDVDKLIARPNSS